MKHFFQNSAFKTVLIIVLIAIPSNYFTLGWFIEISSYAVSLTKGVLGIFLFWVIDKYAVKEIDTIEELKKGNVAYAIFLFGIALIIAAAMLGS
jgi:hypothetical protein